MPDPVYIPGMSQGPPPGPIMRAPTIREQLAEYITGDKFDRDPGILPMMAMMIPDLLAPGERTAATAAKYMKNLKQPFIELIDFANRGRMGLNHALVDTIQEMKAATGAGSKVKMMNPELLEPHQYDVSAKGVKDYLSVPMDVKSKYIPKGFEVNPNDVIIADGHHRTAASLLRGTDVPVNTTRVEDVIDPFVKRYGENDPMVKRLQELMLERSTQDAKASPLHMGTRYDKFYHGSDNLFEEPMKFRPGTDPDTMPSPGAVYVTPDPKFASEVGKYVYEAKINPRLNILDWWTGEEIDDNIRRLYGNQGVADYDRLNRQATEATKDFWESGEHPAPELLKRGIGGIKYDGGSSNGPRSWSLSVSDPNDLTITRRLEDYIVDRLRRMVK